LYFSVDEAVPVGDATAAATAAAAAAAGTVTAVAAQTQTQTQLQSVELKENGSAVAVTDVNVREYVSLRCKHSICNSPVTDAVAAFLYGFARVVPLQLLTVFAVKELELLMCGEASVDVSDWKRNTAYAGVFHKHHKVVKWFWKVIEQMSHEQRLKMIQVMHQQQLLLSLCIHCCCCYCTVCDRFCWCSCRRVCSVAGA